ncbi:murein biosynthesis integral membrane protein MurJ [Nocardioides pakistanensis]
MTARSEPLEAVAADDELTSASSTARDSVTVGLWTSVSRATGVIRVVMIGAVLGPTFFGNAYQLTNSVPNLIFYGFLAGSLLSSLLVPALVRYIDSGRPGDTSRVSGGFLGVAMTALLVAAPVAVLAVPLLLQLAALGEPSAVAADQVAQTRLLLVLAVPQVFLYAVIASATAVSYAHRRYTLAAAAPAVENLGVVIVLGAVAAVYGVDHGSGATVPTGEMLVLGLGSTAAVAVHAALQWWGARRFGVSIRPRAGWRDPEVRTVISRANRALLQSGMLAAQVLLLLVLASRVAGGTVALQISMNFYHLPLALAAAPVGLALLPRLARLNGGEQDRLFADAFGRAVSLALFLVVPAACGYVVLAGPLAETVAAGQMSTAEGVSMVSGSLAAIALGLIGETLFVVSTQAAYSRGQAGVPLVSMALQAAVCLVLATPVLLVDDAPVVALLGAAYAVAAVIGGAHLFMRVRRSCGPTSHRFWPSFLRTAGAAAVMVPVVALVSRLATSTIDGRTGQITAVLAGTVSGALVYGAVHVLLRSAELTWLTEGLRSKRAGNVAVEGDQP